MNLRRRRTQLRGEVDTEGVAAVGGSKAPEGAAVRVGSEEGRWTGGGGAGADFPDGGTRAEGLHLEGALGCLHRG